MTKPGRERLRKNWKPFEGFCLSTSMQSLMAGIKEKY
jgi:hypothetical protein